MHTCTLEIYSFRKILYHTIFVIIDFTKNHSELQDICCKSVEGLFVIVFFQVFINWRGHQVEII